MATLPFLTLIPMELNQLAAALVSIGCPEEKSAEMAALLHRTSVKQLILDLVQDYLRRLEQGRAGQSLFDVNLRWPPSPGEKQARGKRRKS